MPPLERDALCPETSEALVFRAFCVKASASRRWRQAPGSIEQAAESDTCFLQNSVSVQRNVAFFLA